MVAPASWRPAFSWRHGKGSVSLAIILFAVGHLLHHVSAKQNSLRQMLESRKNKFFQIFRLYSVGIRSGKPCHASLGHSMIVVL